MLKDEKIPNFRVIQLEDNFSLGFKASIYIYCLLAELL